MKVSKKAHSTISRGSRQWNEIWLKWLQSDFQITWLTHTHWRHTDCLHDNLSCGLFMVSQWQFIFALPKFTFAPPAVDTMLLRIDATRSIRAIMTLFECVYSSCTLTGYRQIAHIIRCCLPLMIKNTKPLLLAGKCFASVGADLSLHGHRVNENNIIIGCTSHIYSFWPTHSRQKRRPVFIFNINRTAQFNRPRE